MDIFDVCVHKISRFRARKTKNAPTRLKNPTGFGGKALLSYRERLVCLILKITNHETNPLF